MRHTPRIQCTCCRLGTCIPWTATAVAISSSDALPGVRDPPHIRATNRAERECHPPKPDERERPRRATPRRRRPSYRRRSVARLHRGIRPGRIGAICCRLARGAGRCPRRAGHPRQARHAAGVAGWPLSRPYRAARRGGVHHDEFPVGERLIRDGGAGALNVFHAVQRGLLVRVDILSTKQRCPREHVVRTARTRQMVPNSA